MFFKRGCILLTYLTLVTAGYHPKADWFSDVDDKLKESNLIVSNDIPINGEDSSLWSQVMVVKMHYDCGGRLMRQEMAKVKTRAGVDKLPVSGNPGSRYSEGGLAQSPKTEAPVFFRSMKERFKTLRLTTTTQSPAATERPTFRPMFEIGPDRIIDVPIRSCPEGQNEDYLGNCRQEFPEDKP